MGGSKVRWLGMHQMVFQELFTSQIIHLTFQCYGLYIGKLGILIILFLKVIGGIKWCFLVNPKPLPRRIPFPKQEPL